MGNIQSQLTNMLGSIATLSKLGEVQKTGQQTKEEVAGVKKDVAGVKSDFEGSLTPAARERMEKRRNDRQQAEAERRVAQGLAPRNAAEAQRMAALTAQGNIDNKVQQRSQIKSRRESLIGGTN